MNETEHGRYRQVPAHMLGIAFAECKDCGALFWGLLGQVAHDKFHDAFDQLVQTRTDLPVEER